MPEYLAPGVYVEETSFRAKSIEGVGTSTTAFVGPTRRGPIGGTPEMVTSLPDFERIYGSLENLTLGGSSTLNYVAHAVNAYFNNGGSRLYVMRTYDGSAATNKGYAHATLIDGGGDDTKAVYVNARAPGAAYRGSVYFQAVKRPATKLTLGTAPQGSLLEATVSGTATLFVKSGSDWADSSSNKLTLPANPGDTPGDAGTQANLITLSVQFQDADGDAQGWDDLGLAASHPRFIGTVLATTPHNRNDQLQNSIAVVVGSSVTAFDLHAAIVTALSKQADGSYLLPLADGDDGAQPANGASGTAGTYADALAILSGLEDISIVATPGASALSDAQAIQNELIAHAEKRRAYRIAVLDSAANQTPGDMRVARGKIDSKYAALYYPWVVVSNPLARPGRDDIPREIAVPPSGFVTGIYARNDVQRGVYKAPANEVVTGALRFESDINFAQQELLNPLGVNCLRYLSGRGYRLWGARLASSDPEWKYVSDRRYFNYLEASIDRGTQWAVFEPNGERLWANIRQTISDFLYNEWKNGALLGTSTDQAFFVRCDRSTMTQNDLDNGRLVCLIGVAIIKPAEFVIFRIGQKTADAQN
ncbi:MAG: phage tail sheath subtilisin-like domain-containing protein [Betaproteobacteria bacterium]|nr:phage tail sheath subtilisin-like domain-containing protein [Betaproteobacteria bacterium]